LTVGNVNGERITFPVPSGTQVELHVPGLHYNRTLVALCHGGQILMRFDSSILEGATQVHARAVPWQLAEGCIYPIQPRYILPVEELADIAHEYFAGARACLGRRYEVVRYSRVESLYINFFQVLRN
jgi:hypothetical protein